VGLFDGQVAVVTGGGSGLGRATALAFAHEGARVAVADIQDDGGAETVDLIEQAGGSAVYIRTDVTVGADVRNLVAGTVAQFGRLDVAFNNAGVPGRWTNVLDCSEEEWDAVMNINIKSAWLCMKYEIPEMLKLGRGAIVNTASTAAMAAPPHMVSYVASKHGVLGLTRSAATDYAAQNVRVNCLLPGPTMTPMLQSGFGPLDMPIDEMAAPIPMKRLGRPEEQGDAVIWLCSERSSFVTGVALPVDGGSLAAFY
jgi:NAD(P)-dependent dehydrogenase (short-subunit alcohol dehydrogenase family)